MLSVKHCAMSCMAGFVVLASGVAVLAQVGDGVWRLASPETLLAATGGDGACNVKCANPTSCPGGARFNCIDTLCVGGNCPTNGGTDNLPSTYCPGCDLALNGKLLCGGATTFNCSNAVTCGGACVQIGGFGGSFYCGTTGSTGIAPSVVDKFPSGGACAPAGG